jgi:hypothetical protein
MYPSKHANVVFPFGYSNELVPSICPFVGAFNALHAATVHVVSSPVHDAVPVPPVLHVRLALPPAT